MKRNAKNVATTVVIVREQNDDENHAITAYMIILHSENDVRWVLVGWRRPLGYALGHHCVAFGSASDWISLGTPRLVLYKDESIHWISFGQSFNQMILGIL